MTKLEYLKISIQRKAYVERSWVVNCFAIPTAFPGTDLPKNPNPLDVGINSSGVYVYYNEKWVNIDDATIGVPLYNLDDKITIDDDWIVSTGTYETTIGVLLINKLMVEEVFGDKLGYINRPITVREIENEIAKRLTDEVTDDSLTVADLESYMDVATYLISFSDIMVTTNTELNVTSNPAIAVRKAELYERYKDSLSNPSITAKINEELLAMDDDYLKDDVAASIVNKGKIRNVSRRKQHIALGNEDGFGTDTEYVPVKNSLSEGWSTDPKEIVNMFNSSRAGSYLRGKETQKGGSLAIIILRAMATYIVVKGDCGTTEGWKLNITEKNVKNLIDRYIITNNDVVLITEETHRDYINQTVILRSPMYCHSTHFRMCSVCVGTKLARNPKAIPLALTNISSIVLASSMKAMHGKALKTTKLKPTEYIT